MKLLYMFFFFAIGITIGSIFNKIGKHLPNNEKIFKKEKCPNCGYQFEIYERIPLFSYFACSGRCSMCNNRLDSLEVFNEFFTGFLFVVAYSGAQRHRPHTHGVPEDPFGAPKWRD